MPRTTRTTSPKSAGRTTKSAPAAKATPANEAEAAKPAKAERLTSFESHGARFFRLTVPRTWGEEHLPMAGAETWEFHQEADGRLVFTPRAKAVSA